jgi:hypothetical protein
MLPSPILVCLIKLREGAEAHGEGHQIHMSKRGARVIASMHFYSSGMGVYVAGCHAAMLHGTSGHA